MEELLRGINQSALIFLFLLSTCCLSRYGKAFMVLPHSPNYLLRSPDSRETPFPEVLRAYNGFEPGRGWIELRSLMELRIENAYYEKGASRRGLEGFLGTEVARYEVGSHGLRLLSVQSMKERPEGDAPVQDLIPPTQTGFRYYRLYFEIIFRRNNNSHGSVLLAANSIEELDRLSAQLSHPETVCNEASKHRTAFPEACSVSVEMRIVVNGKPQIVLWGSILASLTDRPQHLELRRLYAGRLIPVEINPQDPNALRLPLLPGDHVSWN